jgi:hypothetical protein
LIFILFGANKIRGQFGTDQEWHSIMWFNSYFQNAKRIGQQIFSLTITSMLHKTTEKLPIKLGSLEKLLNWANKDKKLSLEGPALLNDIVTTTHACQILKPLLLAKNTKRRPNQTGPPWHLRVNLSYIWQQVDHLWLVNCQLMVTFRSTCCHVLEHEKMDHL